MTRPTRLLTGRTPLRLESRLAVLLVALAAALAGCKGKEAAKPDPAQAEQAKQLTDCRDKLADKDKYIAKLQEENTRLQMQKGSGEVVVQIVGGNITVKPGPAGGNLPLDEKVAAAGAQEFLGVVERSKGAIQKCYEQALKKNTGLQAVTVSMTLSASFSAAGEFSRMSTSRSLGDTFDTCLRGVAAKWKLPPAPQAMTFQAQVSLSPT
jgi:hypothetical protein